MEFECRHIAKVYAAANGGVRALEDVTFSAAADQFVCIVGPSGCGKTTLLKIIAGLATPTLGTLEFAGAAGGRRPRAALVFQEHGLFPWMTVLDNVAFGLEMQGVPRPDRRDRARAFIDKVGLSSFARSYPHELSVGMQQRVGIIRAFVSNPAVLLLDEPFGSLDAQTRLVLQDELLRIWKDDRKLVIHVTHDIEEAVRLGDRVLVMTGRPGRIREDITIPLGRPREASSQAAPEAAEIRWHIWKLLERDVRKGLWIAG
jgi:NitT/TauT family transport system ATP-binding protein